MSDHTAPDTGTQMLLRCGIVAGPLYTVVAYGQAFTREGFDITRHALSLLSNGSLGWLQIANFLITGVLVIACAVGLGRVLSHGVGRKWGPRLIGTFGAGMIAAGLFVADPALGFPPGTPDGPPTTMTTHGILHFAAGGVGFFALIIACFVFARRFSASGQAGWTIFSVATGTIFLATFMGISSGAATPAVIIAFSLGILLVWAWIAALAAKHTKTHP
jgi:hypothetical protein